MLIIDDDVRNVFALTSALELHGMTVLYSDNGVDGVRLLAEHPEVDIVLMDAMMPDQDGYETTGRSAATSASPTCRWSSSPRRRCRATGSRRSRAGASDYITKPVDLDELLELMAALGDRRRPRGVSMKQARVGNVAKGWPGDRTAPRRCWSTTGGTTCSRWRRSCRGCRWQTVAVESGEAALKQLLVDDFAVILLDAQMPDMDGFETASHIKRRERTRHVPIIFLTAADRDAQLALRGYAVGAVDYLTKPFDPWVLRAKVSIFVDLWTKNRQLQRQAETVRQREAQWQRLADGRGRGRRDPARRARTAPAADPQAGAGERGRWPLLRAGPWAATRLRTIRAVRRPVMSSTRSRKSPHVGQHQHALRRGRPAAEHDQRAETLRVAERHAGHVEHHPGRPVDQCVGHGG